MANQRTWKAQKVIDRLEQKVNRQVMLSLAACVHCGLCTDQCHYVLANPDDPTYAPAYKGDRLRKLFKAHIDWTGRTVPWWVGAKSVYTDEELEDLKDTVFGKCTNCRRCTYNCPMGVDMASFNRMARGLLVHVGVMPEGVAHVAKDQWEIGNQMGVLKEDYLETIQWMEEELQDELSPDIRIPVDKRGAEVVYTINPREAKYDPRTIAEAAAIFHYAGEDWTMTSEGWDMTNFGLFNGDDELGGACSRRVYDAAREIGAKRIVISECGHGYRSTRCEGPNWSRTDLPGIEMESSIVAMLRYIREGRIEVDRSRNTVPVTYHDSCNMARSCGMTEEPRELLRLVCEDFREMYPNRQENFCCTGGGGAMSMGEYAPRRLQSAKVKADQLRATGAKIVVTSCHNCVDGLTDLIKHYKLDMEVKQLVNLVYSAMIVPVPAAEEAMPATAGVEAVPAQALAGYKVLVIDDEPDIRTYLKMIFREEGAEVLEAPDANQGWRQIRDQKPDLVTLDLIMPHKTGEKLYWELRRDENFRALPVMIVTGYGRSDQPSVNFHEFIREKGLPAPEAFLEKPIDPEKTIDTAIQILADRMSAREVH